MMHPVFQFEFSQLKLSVEQVEHIIGNKDDKSRQTIADLISGLLDEAGKVISIKAEYEVFENVVFRDSSKSVDVGNVEFDIRKIVYGQLKKADSIAVFLCTAGEEIGNLSRKAMSVGDLFTGYIYDVIGSEAVEAAADLMQAELERVAVSRGNKITNRFSPGYCSWDVAEQQKLFRLMPENFCRIRLNPSSLMVPEKSISGFIGVGENVRYYEYTCMFCDMEDCIYRKKKVKAIH
jgi:hypothetical protein